MCRNFTLPFLALLLFVILAGCQPVGENQKPSPLGVEVQEVVVAMNFDISGSFEKEFNPTSGRAYKFMVHGLGKFEQQHLGAETRVVLGRIDNTKNSLLFDGTPRDLREKFPDARAMMAHVLKGSDPNGSRVHLSMIEGLEYLMSYSDSAQKTAQAAGVSKKTRTIYLALTDMEDNWPDEEGTKQQLIECLGRYAKTGGALGIYWCETSRAAFWRSKLHELGFRNAVVVAGICESAPLPNFEF